MDCSKAAATERLCVAQSKELSVNGSKRVALQRAQMDAVEVVKPEICFECGRAEGDWRYTEQTADGEEHALCEACWQEIMEF